MPDQRALIRQLVHQIPQETVDGLIDFGRPRRETLLVMDYVWLREYKIKQVPVVVVIKIRSVAGCVPGNAGHDELAQVFRGQIKIELRRELIRRRYAFWLNPNHHSQGAHLTESGRRLMLKIEAAAADRTHAPARTPRPRQARALNWESGEGGEYG